MPDIRRLDSAAPDFAAAIGRLTAVGTPRDEAIDTAVAAIIADVRVRGDGASDGTDLQAERRTLT